MTSKLIKLYVSYAQIAIFEKGFPEPFNEWSDKQIDQGFSWLPGSVSFRALAEDGVHAVEVDIVDHAGEVSADAVRATEVPFEVPPVGAVIVASISDSAEVSIPPGVYLLRCEFLPAAEGNDGRINLVFARKDAPRFAVVRADEELSVGDELLTTAEPAAG